MSILGYSSSYFLPEYWANTPLYGEKIIPLLDYMLSMEYENSANLAQAFYNIENKYRNQSDLPIEVVEEIINENGYSYVKDLLGNNEEGIRLLLSLMVLIHQLKGTKLGIMAVLNLLRRDNSIVTFQIVGSPKIIEDTKEVSDFSINDYVVLTGFSSTNNILDVDLRFSGFTLGQEQCIASVSNYGFYIGVDPTGHLELSLSSNRIDWNIANKELSSKVLTVGSLYYIKLQYDGYEYSLQVSTDGKKYEPWITVVSSESINISEGVIYLGVDNSEGLLRYPFSGYINYSDFSISVDNMEITQWFEQNPVGPENTFMIKTDLDADLVGLDFFSKFSKFIKNYVYPSLTLFLATLKFRSILTFIPFTRSRIDYVAFGEVNRREHFLVKSSIDSAEATDPFVVDDGEGNDSNFIVIKPLSD